MNAFCMSDIESVLVSNEFLENPYPVLHQLREEKPVYWSEAIGGWLLTRYDDIVASFKNTAHFSNENRLSRAVAYLSPERRANYKVFEDHFSTKGLIFSDPPDHTRLRGLVSKVFTPQVVEQMRSRIQDLVNGFLNVVQATGQMDVIADLAVPLPATVISDILGAPSSDRHLFKAWADDLLAFQGVNKPSEETLARAQTALLDVRRYLIGMIGERRARSREDLVSQLVAAEAAGDQLSEPELINTCVTLVIAGHETTASLIGNTVYTLLTNANQIELLRQNPGLLVPTIEESLRYESPVARQPRLMKEDAALGGVKFTKGEMVFQMLNAANRDPAHFSNPDEFDIRRQNNRHIAFGHGIHSCIGALLARTEAQIAIGTVLERMPNLHFGPLPAEWDIEKRNTRVLKTLPVCF